VGVNNGKAENNNNREKEKGNNEQGIEIIEDKHINNNAPSNTPRNNKKSITKRMSKISRLS